MDVATQIRSDWIDADISLSYSSSLIGKCADRGNSTTPIYDPNSNLFVGGAGTAVVTVKNIGDNNLVFTGSYVQDGYASSRSYTRTDVWLTITRCVNIKRITANLNKQWSVNGLNFTSLSLLAIISTNSDNSTT